MPNSVLFQTIQLSISIVFCLHSVNVKIVLFRTILFSISTQFSFIWPINRTLSVAAIPGQSGPGSDGNERVLCIPQSVTGTSPSDCLVSYPGHCREAVDGVFYRPSRLGKNHKAMLKNKPHLVIFHGSILVSLWTFQLISVNLFTSWRICWFWFVEFAIEIIFDFIILLSLIDWF